MAIWISDEGGMEDMCEVCEQYLRNLEILDINMILRMLIHLSDVNFEWFIYWTPVSSCPLDTGIKLRSISIGDIRADSVDFSFHYSTWSSSIHNIHITWLVVSTPLKNISQLGWLFPIYGKIIQSCSRKTTNQSHDIIGIRFLNFFRSSDPAKGWVFFGAIEFSWYVQPRADAPTRGRLSNRAMWI